MVKAKATGRLLGADPSLVVDIPRQPILFDRGGGIDHVLLEQAHRTEDGVEVVDGGGSGRRW